MTLALFDPSGALRDKPLAFDPLGQTLLARGTWKQPSALCLAAAREVAMRCVDESAIVETKICDLLTAVAIPIRDTAAPAGAIVAGWVFTNFPEPISTNRLASALDLGFPETWQLVRQVSPISPEKLALYADLLQMLVDLFMKHRAETGEKFDLIRDLKKQQSELERAARVRDELFAVSPMSCALR